MPELVFTLWVDGDLSAAPGGCDAALSKSLPFYPPRPCEGNPVSIELFIILSVLPAPVYISSH